jgi:branched-chain amino acid aminotransferase
VESLCKQLRVPFERRPVDRSELLVADEVALAGTLGDWPRKAARWAAMPADAPLLTAVGDLYWACVRAETTHPDVRLTPVSFAPRNAEELENAGS